MRRALLVALVLVTVIGGACSGDKSKELFDTAQFEEKQNNREHAAKLYEEILAKYPGSPLAKPAQERLDELKAKR